MGEPEPYTSEDVDFGELDDAISSFGDANNTFINNISNVDVVQAQIKTSLNNGLKSAFKAVGIDPATVDIEGLSDDLYNSTMANFDPDNPTPMYLTPEIVADYPELGQLLDRSVATVGKWANDLAASNDETLDEGFCVREVSLMLQYPGSMRIGPGVLPTCESKTAKWLKEHFGNNWWKYLVAGALIAITVTALEWFNNKLDSETGCQLSDPTTGTNQLITNGGTKACDCCKQNTCVSAQKCCFAQCASSASCSCYVANLSQGLGDLGTILANILVEGVEIAGVILLLIIAIPFLIWILFFIARKIKEYRSGE